MLTPRDWWRGFKEADLARMLPFAIVLLGALSWLMIHQGLDAHNARKSGVPGQVTVVGDCSENKGTWICPGDFTSQDGRTRISGVKLQIRAKSEPSGVVDAVVSGPDADYAWAELAGDTMAGVVVGAVVGLGALAVAGYMVGTTYAEARREAARAAPPEPAYSRGRPVRPPAPRRRGPSGLNRDRRDPRKRRRD